MRRKSRSVLVGGVGIGGEYPISIQSMTNVRIDDVDASVEQIVGLCADGCEIVRLAVPKPTDVRFFEKIKSKLRSRGMGVPLVADVHFSPRIAHDCLAVADKVRINAGNFAEKFEKQFNDARNFAMDKFAKFFAAAKAAGTPVRVGVNAGSMSRRMLETYGNTSRGMWESANECIVAANSVGFEDLILSFKASDVEFMVSSYRFACLEMDRLSLDYPLHLGVTEAGNRQYARIKSAVGIGSLLIDGIGDTIRVSLTEVPNGEIQVARDILQATGRRRFSPEFIACPSCGRTNYDIQRVFESVKEKICGLAGAQHLKVAVMGCVVNGIGEAGDADYAVVGLPSGNVDIYKRNIRVLGNVAQEVAADSLVEIIQSSFKSDQSDQRQLQCPASLDV